jgi:hypothetical protein
MPKVKRKRKSKVSAAWKKLRKQHRKGPSRVNVRDPRQKDGVNPLYDPANTRKIQIWYYESESTNKLSISVVVFNRAFEQLGLYKGSEISMSRGRLKTPGRALKKTFVLFNHNDRIEGDARELKLEGIVGRCLVFTKSFVSTPDAVLHILPSVEETRHFASTAAHVEALFEPRISAGPLRVNIEYM